MNIHMSKRLFVAAAVLGALAVFAAVFFVAVGIRSVVAGPDSGPAAAPPNPGHSWGEIGDLPGTMWHSNNDGPASGLDADTLDGQHANQIHDADDYVSNAGYCAAAGNADTLDGQHADAFWNITGNSGTTGSNFLGTTDNQALELAVNGSRALRLEPNAISPNVVGGYSGNSVTVGVYGAAICGGGYSGYPNSVTDDYGTVGGGGGNQAGNNTGTTSDAYYATVGGGFYNSASTYYATVGGGHQNTASGREAAVAGGWNNTASGNNAAVGGGESNTASGTESTVGGGDENMAGYVGDTVGGGDHNIATGGRATVGGGFYNSASTYYATVGGGDRNTATGAWATVPGGAVNIAAGEYSFAAGRFARANHNGAFVWADNHAVSFGSERDDQFRVRADGGARLDDGDEWVDIRDDGTNLINTSTGARLTLAGAWTNVSDAAMKENFSPVDGQQVLASLAEMPITTWSHEAEDASIHHMGPTAQDFYAAFGLGESDTSISTVDTDGVALAAIQGLYEIVQEQDERIDALGARVAALEGGAPLNEGSQSLLSSIIPFGPFFLAGLFVGGLMVVQRRRARD